MFKLHTRDPHVPEKHLIKSLAGWKPCSCGEYQRNPQAICCKEENLNISSNDDSEMSKREYLCFLFFVTPHFLTLSSEEQVCDKVVKEGKYGEIQKFVHPC